MTVGELTKALEYYDSSIEVFFDIPGEFLHPYYYYATCRVRDVEEGSSYGTDILAISLGNSWSREDCLLTFNSEMNEELERPECPECSGHGQCLICGGYGYLEPAYFEALAKEPPEPIFSTE